MLIKQNFEITKENSEFKNLMMEQQNMMMKVIENGTTNNSLFTNNGESLTIVNPNLQNIVVNNFPVNQNVKFRCTMIDAKGVVILQEINVKKDGTTVKSNCQKEDISYLP